MSIQNEINIGSIGNYYGGLLIKTEDDKYYWGIESYSRIDWEEIPKHLYLSLLEYEENRKTAK
jgi:hypothetical protein